MPSGKSYGWAFEKHGQSLVIDSKGELALDNPESVADTVVSGLGIAYVPDRVVARYLADAWLVKVVEDGCPPIPGVLILFGTSLYSIRVAGIW